MLYAIVDIETTGGFAQGAKITEIAIVVTDGESVIETFESLVNPEQLIPYFITKLTGITDEMVATAPTFETIADRVYQILADKIFVAHNVSFDYSFVNHQLKANGFILGNKKLCTVRYGRKVITGLKSYSLGNFCNALDIPIENRHRAMGDCYATFLLLKTIIQNDHTQIINEFVKHHTPYKNIPLQVDVSQYQQIPSEIGVYYFLDNKEKIIYVGKAINLKKRIASHFTGNKLTKQRQDFIREIAIIKYQILPTELISLVIESTEIKNYWPKYNVAQKHGEAKFAIYQYEDRNGYLQLCVDKYKKNLPQVICVKNKIEGLIQLRQITFAYNLCPFKTQVAYIATETNHINCTTECGLYNGVKKYNYHVQKAIKQLQQTLENYLIIDKGLSETEVSVIVVEKGAFIAFGYLPKKSNRKYTWKDAVALTQYNPNNYINILVQQAAQASPEKVIYFK